MQIPRHFPALLALIFLALQAGPALAQSGPTSQIKVISGLLPAGRDAETGWPMLFLATRWGLMRAGPDGVSELQGAPAFGLSGMAADPSDPARILAAGFTREGRSPVLLQSRDRAASWERLPDPGVALRALTFSPSDPKRVYAIGKDLMFSGDGGRTWRRQGALPGDTFTLAVSGEKGETLYAATMKGLMQSTDEGTSWARAYPDEAPATMVHARSDGQLTAFIFGKGLVRSDDGGASWRLLNDAFGNRYVLNYLPDAENPQRILLTTDSAGILLSRDGGTSWTSYEGSQRDSPENIARGKALFASTCQACHGIGGIGEAPDDPDARDEFGFKAPALNDDAHAWHHDDRGLMATIRLGSPNNKRMVAFGEILSETDIADIVTYLKSTWSLNSLACQGSRHMNCQ